MSYEEQIINVQGTDNVSRNMHGYLSADIIRSEKRKTVSYEELIMSKDKYPSIFSPQMATIVFIILQIFFAMREVLKIGEYSRIFPSFSWGIFGHVTRLGQSRVSKKMDYNQEYFPIFEIASLSVVTNI